MKRKTGIPVLAMMGVLALGAFTDAKVTLRHFTEYGLRDQEGKYIKGLAEAFTRKTGIVIKLEMLGSGPEAMIPKLTSMAAAGVMPDVVGNVGSGSNFYDLFLDLKPYMSSDPLCNNNSFMKQSLSPYILPAASKWKGKVWGLPASTWTTALAYNTAMIAEAGLPSPNSLGQEWTWEQMASYAVRLTKDTNGDGKPDVLGLNFPAALIRWGVLVHQAGGSYANATVNPTKVTFNTPEAVKAMSFLSDLALRKKVVEYTNWYNVFNDGKTAMTWDGGPNIISMPKVKAKFDYAPYPRGPKTVSYELTANGYSISRSTKHKKEAWQWLRFIVADKASAKGFVKATGRLPALRGMADDYSRIVDKAPPGSTIFGTIPDDDDSYVRPVFATSRVRDISDAWLLRILQGKVSVEQGMNGMNDECNKVLKSVLK